MKHVKRRDDQWQDGAGLRRRGTVQAVSSALVLISLGLAMGAAEAKIAQESLIVKDRPLVEPNLMFTLDDSGSMSYNFVPDNEMGGQVFAYHPREPKRYVYTVQGVLPTDDKTVVGARRRSPQINKIYYNPEVRYLPWIDPASVKVDDEGKPSFSSLPDADPRAAYVHWNYQAGGKEAATRNLRVDLTGDQPRAALRICAGTRPEKKYDDPCPELAGATHVAPATYYNYIGADPDTATWQDKDTMANYRRVSIKDHSEFLRGKERTDCKLVLPDGRRRCTQAEEYQNFANWYQYHRTRMHVAIASVGRAFASLPPTVRVGYGRINKGTTDGERPGNIDGKETSVIERGVRLFSGEERKSFFVWLNDQIASGGTPLLEATRVVGEYFSRADNNGPWSAWPGMNDSSKHISCRRSYHLLMTDGLYNETERTLKGWNQIDKDNEPGPRIFRPDGVTWWQYQPQVPYASPAKRTLADFSMHYWNRDLRPDLRNDVEDDAENPAYWQHLTMYTLSFGVGGKLVPPTPGRGEDSQGDWPALLRGEKTWPTKIQENEIETIDDLWHAAVNSRGEYLSVQDGSGFLNSVSRMLGKIVARQGSTGGVAVSSQALQTGNQKFVPSFMTGLGTGDLKSFGLEKDGSQGALQWSAADKMLVPAQRKLFVGNGMASGTRSTALAWDGLPSALKQDLLKAAGVGEATGTRLVSYFRGDKVDEDSGTFRKRNSLLGHIVHSSPVYIGAAIDRGYQYLPPELPAGEASGAATYREHVRAKKAHAGRPGQVFVGSNDGILHAFDAATGVESYGYVPRAVAVEMARQSRPKTPNRLMMDGPLVESDAWWDGKWHNVLLGTTGAGPRAVFALNVTDTRPGKGLNANTLLWELDESTQPELGHVLAAPEIGVMRDGTWVAVVGNGYESRSRRAQLFVLELKTGRVLARLDTGAGSDKSPNGLGGVRLIRDGNHVVTGAYAGDLMGNVWKFDLASTASKDWKVAFSGKPLFRTEGRRPVTAAPSTVSHPAGGTMVLVGTGKLFEEGDNGTRDLESVYGLWDKERLGKDAQGMTIWLPGGTTIEASAVRKRTVKTVSEGGRDFAVIDRDDKANQVLDWRQDRGWRIGLDMIREQGQRNIVSPQLVSGLVLFETMSPVIDESEQLLACRPDMNTPAFNLLVDPLSGRMTKKALIDTNKDGVIDGKDKAVAGWAQDDWTGRSVVLSDEPEAPCTSANCQQLSKPMKPCPPGNLANSLLNVNQSTTVCVEMPGPNRWWWRELTIQDKDYGTGKAADQVKPAASN